MGFSFKVAPGVRIRASSRGVRTSIGPRVARAHVGAGRTAVSTGLGPVGLSSSLPRARTRSVRTSQRALQQAIKQEQARELRQALEDILTLHHTSFPPASRPQARGPAPVDEHAVHAAHRKRALAGIGRLQRQARRAAKEYAAATAQTEINQLREVAHQQQKRLQHDLDQQWQALLRNDPDVVLAVLNEAFADNEAPAAAVGVDGADVSLVVLVPALESMPERKPDLTPAGNLTLKKLTKAERATLHASVVASHVLLTIKEAFAVAPSLLRCQIMAIQHAGADAYGKPQVAALLAGRFRRSRLNGVRWEQTPAIQIIGDIADELERNTRQNSAELRPLIVQPNSSLARLLSQIDVIDLLTE